LFHDRGFFVYTKNRHTHF